MGIPGTLWVVGGSTRVPPPRPSCTALAWATPAQQARCGPGRQRTGGRRRGTPLAPACDPYLDRDCTGNVTIPFNRTLAVLRDGARQQVNEINSFIGQAPTPPAPFRIWVRTPESAMGVPRLFRQDHLPYSLPHSKAFKCPRSVC